MRDIFNASTTENNQELHIHLNDDDSSVLARNIIMLKITSADDFNPDNEDDCAFLWDVWYNAEWSENTKTRFQSALNDLLASDNLPGNVTVPQQSHLQSLKEVWTVWSEVCSKTLNQSKQLVKKIQKER